MKILLLGILLALLSTVPLAADDFVYHGSFLWNDIRALTHSGDFLFCAFHDGIGTINLDLDFNKKKLYSTLELEGSPRRLHLFGSLLVVEKETGAIDLVDVDDPANMILLGSFTPGVDSFDLELIGDYLYMAIEYDGVIRFDISNPTDIRFDDSSMAGISVTQLDVKDNRLYALDDYNGILIYEPDTAGFGNPVSELLLPQQAVSFTVLNDTIYAGVKPNGYMVGSITDIYNPQYLGIRSSFIRGDLIAGTPKGLVFANSISGFELIYNGDSLSDQLFPISGIIGYPEVYSHGERNYIAYPHETNGFVVYDIDDPEYIDLEYPDLVYAYPGPITQVQFVNSRLHVVGIHNWYEIYDLVDPDNPFRSGKMINPPYRPIGMCAKGDTIFVADLTTNTFFPAVDDGFGDPYAIFPFFSVADSIERPHIIPGYFGDMDLLYFINNHRLNGTARNESIAIANAIRWSFPTGVSAVVFDGSLLYRVSSKGVLFIHRIENDYELTSLVQIGLPARVNDMFKQGTFLYTGGMGLRTYSLEDALAPELIHSIGEIGTVYEMHKIGSRLICACYSGVHVFDISGGIPELLFSGGDKAKLVSYDENTFAISESYSVKIYTLPASDVDDNLPVAYDYSAPRLFGYPNPFNPEITLILENFSLRARLLTVDIYDIIGRRIRRLPVALENRTRLDVRWDGRDEEGQTVPSGIYLFRAGDGSQEAVFKAVLLK